MEFPAHLPELPENENEPWSANAVECYDLIRTNYARAYRSLQQIDDRLRLTIAKESLIDTRPLVVALHQEGLEEDWAEAIATCIYRLELKLEEAAAAASGRCSHSIFLACASLMGNLLSAALE